MEKLNLDVSFSDDRGQIIDMLANVNINAVTLITFKKNAVRANHHHKLTTQWNYVLSGSILIRTQKPSGPVIDTVMHKGDFVVTVPNERHALQAMEDSELLVFTEGPRGGKEYESDTYRDQTPLINPAS
ncbi:MAG: cupin domain-containing protein [Nitrospirota bacterium]|nr:cupin domain-containing protein [Nitrospirota bacterium]